MLVSIWDFEYGDMKFSKKSSVLTSALKVTKERKQTKIEQYEEVDEIGYVLLACHDIMNVLETRGRNVK